MKNKARKNNESTEHDYGKSFDAFSSSGHKIDIDLEKFNSGKNSFRSLYSAIDGLSYSTFLARFDTKLKNIFLMEDEDDYSGLVFHYGFDKDTRSIVYLITKGNIETGHLISFHPFESSNGENLYYKFSQNSARVTDCGQDEFNKLTADYLRQMLRIFVNNGELEPISDFANHAKMVYHDKEELRDFYEAYENRGNLCLYVTHGCSMSRPHTPMFRFGDHVKMFEIDDNVNDSDNRYRNKAFNIGQLCPPDCAPSSPTP